MVFFILKRENCTAKKLMNGRKLRLKRINNWQFNLIFSYISNPMCWSPEANKQKFTAQIRTDCPLPIHNVKLWDTMEHRMRLFVLPSVGFLPSMCDRTVEAESIMIALIVPPPADTWEKKVVSIFWPCLHDIPLINTLFWSIPPSKLIKLITLEFSLKSFFFF